MPLSPDLTHFLASVHPYDSLPDAALSALSEACEERDFGKGEQVFSLGDDVEGLFVIAEGEIEVTDEADVQISILGPRNSFGERALLRGDTATRKATATRPARTIMVPSQTFHALFESHGAVRKFFDRRRPQKSGVDDLGTMRVERLMTPNPVACEPDTSIRDAASLLHKNHISAICVCAADVFQGILTLRDINSRVVVAGRSPDAPVSSVMTANPLALAPDALVTDVLHLMVEKRIGHIPIVSDGTLQGIVTQTDLTRAQALSSADIVRRVARAGSADEMARATAEIPQLLVQLVEAGNRHEVITRLITDIADTATRRLLALAEERLGLPPCAYLWLACGSQGRQEQSSVSDQDNCLILSEEARAEDMAYFAELAAFVCDGLNRCGYVYCPGDMMATNSRWCQPLPVWIDYFKGWIAKPNPEAQMLASVMFDLRPIGGDARLFDGLHDATLDAAARNSIFTAHMIANSLKHHPPLGLLRGLATIRSGEHRNELDLKLSGVVPVVDLGRIYALQGRLKPANTRARLEVAIEAGAVSRSGGADLLDAYDHIATTRLAHQAAQIKAGQPPSNYLDPSALSDFERSHLRDAFVVVKTMQSAAGSGTGALG